MVMLLIIDSPTDRDPLLWDIYQYMQDNLGAHLTLQVNANIEDIIWEELDGEIPTRVYQGFTLGRCIRNSTRFINENNIPVSVAVGDPNLFTTKVNYTWHLWGIRTIDQLILPWPDLGPDYLFEKRITEFQNSGWKAADITLDMYGTLPETFLRGAEHVHMPWCVNPDNWPLEGELMADRDTDVSLVCTIDPQYDKHANRRKAKTRLAGITGITKAIGRTTGAYYHRLLLDTKIFIVLSGNNFLTQKYFEGAMNGCLLAGDIPDEPYNVFVDGETMTSLPGKAGFQKRIKHYLANPEERTRVALECRRRIIKSYNIETSMKEFKEAIK